MKAIDEKLVADGTEQSPSPSRCSAAHLLAVATLSNHASTIRNHLDRGDVGPCVEVCPKYTPDSALPLTG
jgi:hypothetical protein